MRAVPRPTILRALSSDAARIRTPPGMPPAKKRRSMQDIQEQLAELRQRIARVDRKYASSGAAAVRAPQRASVPSRHFIENLMSGEVVRTALGEHFETERLWERHRRYGSID